MWVTKSPTITTYATGARPSVNASAEVRCASSGWATRWAARRVRKNQRAASARRHPSATCATTASMGASPATCATAAPLGPSTTRNGRRRRRWGGHVSTAGGLEKNECRVYPPARPRRPRANDGPPLVRPPGVRVTEDLRLAPPFGSDRRLVADERLLGGWEHRHGSPLVGAVAASTPYRGKTGAPWGDNRKVRPRILRGAAKRPGRLSSDACTAREAGL